MAVQKYPSVQSALEALDQAMTASVSDQNVPQDTTIQTGIPQDDSYLDENTADSAMTTKGGIDLNRAKMQMNVRKEGAGVQMQFDPAMIERIKRDGFDGLDFKIDTIIPITNLPMLLGLREDEQQGHPQLAGGVM